MRKNNMYLKVALIYIVAALLCFFVEARASDTGDEPIISNFQGSDPTTSLVEVEWPDGKVEKLLYKNVDVDNGSKAFVKWFVERCRAAEKRIGRKLCRDDAD